MAVSVHPGIVATGMTPKNLKKLALPFFTSTLRESAMGIFSLAVEKKLEPGFYSNGKLVQLPKKARTEQSLDALWLSTKAVIEEIIPSEDGGKLVPIGLNGVK